MILLDTHVLVWMAADDRRLGRKARALINRDWPEGQVSVASITFWETALLERRGWLSLPAPVIEWRTQLLDAGLTELALDGRIMVGAVTLDGLHDDPADRMIAATAVEHDAELVTADDRLLRWTHTLTRHDARR